MVKAFARGNRFIPLTTIAEAAVDWQGLPPEQQELVVVEDGLPYLAGVPELTERAEALLYGAETKKITGATFNEDGNPLRADLMRLDRASVNAFIALTSPQPILATPLIEDVLIKEPEVLKMLGITHSTLFRGMEAGTIPRNAATGPNRWRKSDIAAVVAIGGVRKRNPKNSTGLSAQSDDI